MSEVAGGMQPPFTLSTPPPAKIERSSEGPIVPITFFCDGGQRLEVQEAFIGTQRRCRACRRWLTVPAAGTFVSTLVPDKPKEQEEADPRYRASWVDVAWILSANVVA